MIPTPITPNFRSQALSDAELHLEARSIFATGPMNGLSQRYKLVPTTEIVAGLRAKNWLPVHVEQQRVRLESQFGFQKHLIRFRRAEQMQTPELLKYPSLSQKKPHFFIEGMCQMLWRFRRAKIDPRHAGNPTRNRWTSQRKIAGCQDVCPWERGVYAAASLISPNTSDSFIAA